MCGYSCRPPWACPLMTLVENKFTVIKQHSLPSHHTMNCTKYIAFIICQMLAVCTLWAQQLKGYFNLPHSTSAEQPGDTPGSRWWSPHGGTGRLLWSTTASAGWRTNPQAWVVHLSVMLYSFRSLSTCLSLQQNPWLIGSSGWGHGGHRLQSPWCVSGEQSTCYIYNSSVVYNVQPTIWKTRALLIYSTVRLAYYYGQLLLKS